MRIIFKEGPDPSILLLNIESCTFKDYPKTKPDRDSTAICPEELQIDEKLLNWVQGRLSEGNATVSFESTLQYFVMLYSWTELPQVRALFSLCLIESNRGITDGIKYKLATAVHKMYSFFCIRRWKSFLSRDASGAIKPLPGPVQAEIWKSAREQMSISGCYVLEMLETIIRDHDPKTKRALLGENKHSRQARLATWCSFWLLLLMHRDMLDDFAAQYPNSKDLHKSTEYRKIKQLLTLLSAFYHQLHRQGDQVNLFQECFEAKKMNRMVRILINMRKRFCKSEFASTDYILDG